MGNHRRNFSATFKAQVAIEALRERETLEVLAQKYGVSKLSISKWKAELQANANKAFGPSKEELTTKKEDELLRKIGELEMCLDFAKRVSRKLGIEIPANL